MLKNRPSIEGPKYGGSNPQGSSKKGKVKIEKKSQFEEVVDKKESKEVKKVIFQKIVEKVLEKGLISESESIINLAKEQGIEIDFPKTIEVYEKGIENSLNRKNVMNAYSLLKVAEKYCGREISNEIYEKVAIDLLLAGNVINAEEIVAYLERQGIKIKISKEEISNKIKEHLENGDASAVAAIVDFAKKREVEIEIPKEKEIYEKGIKKIIFSDLKIERIINLCEKYSIEIGSLKEIYSYSFKENLNEGNFYYASMIINSARSLGIEIEIPKEKEIYEKCLIKALENGEAWHNIERIIFFVKYRGIEIEIPKEKEIYEINIKKLLEKSNIEWVIENIKSASKYGVDLDKKFIEEIIEFYEKNIDEDENVGYVEEIVFFAKEKGIQLLPKFYKKAVIAALKTGVEGYVEKCIDFAKNEGIEIKMKDEIQIAATILPFRNPNLGHTEKIRREKLMEAKEYGLTYEDIINIDLADYLDIPKEKRLDLTFEEKDYKIVCKGILDEFNVTKGKYILGVDKDNKPTLIFDSTLGEHKDIAFKYLVVPDGGGRMKIDKESKRIEVYDSSKAFGEADKEKTIEYLKRVFKDYEIVAVEEEK
jgi:hypothetical protein